MNNLSPRSRTIRIAIVRLSQIGSGKRGRTILSLSAALAVGAASMLAQAGAPPRLPVTVQYHSTISCLSWSPQGDRLVYRVGNELHDWPRGRTLALRGAEENTLPYPLGEAVKWRADGRELSVNLLKGIAYVIDVDGFRIRRVFGNTQPYVYSVWWDRGQLCRVEAPRFPDEFRSSDRHQFYCDGKKRYGPPGMMVTDVSDNGEAMLVRVAGKHVRGWNFENVALVKRDPGTNRVVWIKRLYRKAWGVLEFTVTDTLVWNQEEESGAVILGTDTGGGDGSSALYVMAKLARFDIQDSYPEDAGPLDAHCQPTWVRDRVLVVMRPSVGPRCMVLWDPRRGAVQTLLSGPGKDPWGDGVYGAAAARDGKTVAYTVSSDHGKLHRLVITTLEQLRAHPKRN